MVVFIFFIQVLIEPFIRNRGDPDQTPKNESLNDLMSSRY